MLCALPAGSEDAGAPGGAQQQHGILRPIASAPPPGAGGGSGGPLRRSSSNRSLRSLGSFMGRSGSAGLLQPSGSSGVLQQVRRSLTSGTALARRGGSGSGREVRRQHARSGLGACACWARAPLDGCLLRGACGRSCLCGCRALLWGGCTTATDAPARLPCCGGCSNGTRPSWIGWRPQAPLARRSPSAISASSSGVSHGSVLLSVASVRAHSSSGSLAAVRGHSHSPSAGSSGANLPALPQQVIQQAVPGLLSGAGIIV